MTDMEFDRLFDEIFEKNGLERFCTEPIKANFAAFTSLLQRENAHTNLTAIRETADIVSKHYADSLLAENLFPPHATVLDVGCGGGFPCIPLAIVRPDLRITAVDSTAKKIRFVEKAAAELGLDNLTPICARIEEESMRGLRESFDVVTSRAMARMNILAELTLPFARVGGRLVALKGAAGSKELAEAARGIALLGGEIAEDCRLELQTVAGSEARHLLVIEKTRKTLAAYPRAYAAIVKKPL